MKSNQISFARCALIASLLACSAFAQPGQTPVSAQKYKITLVSFYEADPREQMITIIFPDGSGGYIFKSVDLLKKFIATLPHNATLEWAPSDVRIGGEPLLSSEQQMSDFKDYCRQKGVNLILVPAG